MIQNVLDTLQKEIDTSDPNSIVENMTLLRDVINHSLGFRGIRRGEGLDFSYKRDIDQECQYPDDGELTAYRYVEFYERFSVAKRVVDIWPEECWKEFPTVFETEDDSVTPFEASYEMLRDNLSQTSWLAGAQDPILQQCKQADTLRGVAHYCVVYVGLSDVQNPEDLLKPVMSEEERRAEGTSLTVNFFRTFTEEQAKISSFETEPGPRQNKPKTYQIDFQGVEEGAENQPTGGGVEVHWSRVIHVPSEGKTKNDTFGTPRMRPVMNNLVDLRKLYGGSAEMYWQGALPGTFFETHPQLGDKIEVDEASLSAKMQELRHGLRRHAAFVGGTVNNLAPTVSDPTAQIDVQLEAICVVGGYPKRVFLGSEVGELSSTQDTLRWNGRVKGRQHTEVTPNVIATVVDHLIMLGVLTEPTEGYKAKWPEMEVSSEVERMDVLLKKVEAFVKYVQGDVNTLIGERDFLERLVGMDAEEVEEILDNVIDELDEEELLRGFDQQTTEEEPGDVPSST